MRELKFSARLFRPRTNTLLWVDIDITWENAQSFMEQGDTVMVEWLNENGFTVSDPADGGPSAEWQFCGAEYTDFVQSQYCTDV